MERAGAAEHENYLAIILWALGSNAPLRQLLDGQPLTVDRPHYVWEGSRPWSDRSL